MKLTMNAQQLNEFVDYFWMFYGPGGVFETKGLTRDMAERSCSAYYMLSQSAELDKSEMYPWANGDTEDRIGAYQVCLFFYGIPGWDS